MKNTQFIAVNFSFGIGYTQCQQYGYYKAFEQECYCPACGYMWVD